MEYRDRVGLGVRAQSGSSWLGVSQVRPQVLLLDPYDPYAERFIRAYAQNHGIQSVCVFTDPVQLRRQAWRYPVLRSAAIAARYLATPDQFGSLARWLKQHHNISAVVPYVEGKVSDSVLLAEMLGLHWAQPRVMTLFRDKHALKKHLMSLDDGPRVNKVALVRSVQEIRQNVAEGQFTRFVLKPNDGVANAHVEFFSSDDRNDKIRAFLHTARREALIMEEFIDGPEFFVNGQTDADGRVAVVRVGRYDRRQANGKDNMPFTTRVVHRSEPGFPDLVKYARDVIEATGLRRSPFHLEAKVDTKGPCLIEVGARLAGAEEPLTDDAAHGSLDTFGLAAHYYLTTRPYGGLGLDWKQYDSRALGHAIGISSADTRIFELRGVAEVEARPSFQWWVSRPAVGDRVRQSLDILGLPWEVVLACPTNAALSIESEEVRSLLHWNDVSTGLLRTVRRVAAEVPVARRQVMQRVNQLPLDGWTA